MEKPTHKILANVYFIHNSDGFKDEAVPEYELIEAGIDPSHSGSFHGFLYIEAGDFGWFEDGNFENEEGSSSRIQEEYIELL